MSEQAESGWAGRLLAALAACLFAGIPLAVGIALERPAAEPGPGQVVGTPSGRRQVTLIEQRTPARHLRITDGPRLESGRDGPTYIVWRTSVPADSCVLYGRSHPAEHVAAKDARLLAEHRFPLPEADFAPLCRMRVISVSEAGEVASGDLGPGAAGEVFVTAPAEYDPFRQMAFGTASAWADCDGDGRLDLAVCRRSEGEETLSVATVRDGRGASRSALQPPTRLEAHCQRLHWADFSADGRPDLLVAGDSLAVYYSSGPAAGALRDAVTLAQGGAGARGSAAADVDGDGLPDVLAVNAIGELTFYRNEGQPAGRSGPPVVLWRIPEQGEPAASARSKAGTVPLIPADFTGDGRTDVCLLSPAPAVLVGGPQGYAPLEGAFPSGMGLSGDGAWAEAADWDADGDMDLYLGGPGGGHLLQNDGVGRFEAVTLSSGELADLKGDVACGAWADFDGNGYDDLVLGLSGGGVRLYLNDGRGRFMDATELCALPVLPDKVPVAVTAVDLDNDCAPDLQVVLSDQAALLLENRWRGLGPDGGPSHVKVRPSGERGLCGCAVLLRERETGRLLASARIGLGGTGPGEHCFGVRGLAAMGPDASARIEVVFSDGLVRSALWRASAAPWGPVTVSRTVDAVRR